MYRTVALLSALAASTSAAPITANPATLAARTTYVQYNGNGSPQDGWPTQDQWPSFDSLWSDNYNDIANSCEWNNWGANNSPDEISNLQSAILNVASQTGMDSRFVLAIVMQESKGCVRVPTTNNGVRNPGLMQSHNGAGTCAGVNPCPNSEIVQMIQDGTAGTPYGDGIEQTTASTGESGAQGMYAGARKYNSGSVDLNDLGQAYGSTPSYASDVANRCMGWTG